MDDPLPRRLVVRRQLVAAQPQRDLRGGAGVEADLGEPLELPRRLPGGGRLESFVARLDQDGEGRAVVYATVSLATALGVRVTGEGIETAPQLATLVELGCHHGQGFLLGRPAPAEELTAALRTVDADAVSVAARLARLL